MYRARHDNATINSRGAIAAVTRRTRVCFSVSFCRTCQIARHTVHRRPPKIQMLLDSDEPTLQLSRGHEGRSASRKGIEDDLPFNGARFYEVPHERDWLLNAVDLLRDGVIFEGVEWLRLDQRAAPVDPEAGLVRIYPASCGVPDARRLLEPYDWCLLAHSEVLAEHQEDGLVPGHVEEHVGVAVGLQEAGRVHKRLVQHVHDGLGVVVVHCPLVDRELAAAYWGSLSVHTDAVGRISNDEVDRLRWQLSQYIT